MAPKLRAIPGSLTTDAAVMPDARAQRAIADIARARVEKVADLVARTVKARGENPEESEEYRLIAEIRDRKSMLEPEQARLRAMFRRWDNLYNPETISLGGADHWPLTQDQNVAGKVHISINTPPVYVEIPAALQAVPPVENYVPASVEEDDRKAAGRRERLYFQWKEEDEFELKVQKACVVKALYGFTYAKVYWDSIEERPTVTVLTQPENLYVGWGNSDYTKMDWAIYCYGLSPQGVAEEFGLSVDLLKDEKADTYFPYVGTGTHDDPLGTKFPQRPDDNPNRPRDAYEQTQVEVYDYWYKKPGRLRKGKASKPEVWNAIYVGNHLVKPPTRHTEYDDVPYAILPNTFIPGLPYGKSELYDIEQIIREKDERVTAAAQMIQSVVGGQMWQLIGPEAPDDVPSNAIPKPNKVSTPGAGNEIKAIQPFIPQFVIEDFLKRLDVEAETITGLNELLLGRAPATILGSSKAIAALVANYESRIQMRRALLYAWRKRIWKMAAQVWERKAKDVADIIDGAYRLEIKPPELTPRDEMENSQRAINLVQNRIWSAERAMDATGVEDPGEEKSLIREEQTDPAMNPASVTQQATLLGTLQSLGIQPPQESVAAAQNASRTLNRPAAGSSSLNAPENQGNPPQETLPGNAQPGNAVLQTLVNGEGAQGRVLTNTPLDGGGGGQ